MEFWKDEVKKTEAKVRAKRKRMAVQQRTLEVNEKDFQKKKSLFSENQNQIRQLGLKIEALEKSMNVKFGKRFPSTEKLFASLKEMDNQVKSKKFRRAELAKKREEKEIAESVLQKKLILLNEQIQSLKVQLVKMQEEGGELKKEKEAFEKKATELMAEVEEFKARQASSRDLEDELARFERKARELEGVQDREGRLETVQREIRRKTQTFRGELGDLVTLVDAKYRVACGLALGSKLGYFVIDRQAEFDVVDQLLKESFLSKNVLVLENYSGGKNIHLQRMRMNVMESGWLAYDLLEMRDKSDRLLDSYLKGVLADVYVTLNVDLAFKLKKKLKNKFRKIITLEGEMVKPSSIESLGHGDSVPFYVKKLQDWNIVRERARIGKKIDSIKEKLNELEGEGPKKQFEKIQSQISIVSEKMGEVLRETEKITVNLAIKEEEKMLDQRKSDFIQKEIGQNTQELGKIN